jgi:hypothetical protein
LASEQSLSFSAGWFGNPVYINGDYPSTVKATLGHLLPTFTPAEQKLLLGSADFYAWDAYTGYPVRASTTAAGGTVAECASNPNHDNWPKCAEEVMILPNGWIIGTKSDDGTAGWLHDTPNYFRQGVVWSWNFFRRSASGKNRKCLWLRQDMIVIECITMKDI